MNNNFKKIIDLLSNDHWISASEIAKKLSVSPRQVRKYIHELRKQNNNLIESSYYGYRLSQKYYPQIEKLNFNYSLDNRITYIVQKLIIHPLGIDIFELGDELYISESTLENDLKKVKEILINYHLTLERQHGCLFILGNEKEKRKLMNYLLSEYGYDSIKFGKKIAMFQEEYNISDFSKPLHNILENNNLIADEYSFHNILFHLIITIDRIHTQNKLNDELQFSIDFHNSMDIERKNTVLEIAQFLKENYQVILNDAEIINLYIIIVGNTKKSTPIIQTEKTLEIPLNQEYILLSKELLHEISSTYYLEQFTDEFIFQFAIHINNMLDRIHMGYEAKKPMTLTIKQNYPFIYDIAVFLAQCVSQKYHISVNEAEITFISFHIGGFLENQAKSDKIITCAFIYSSFLQLYTHYIDKLYEQFPKTLLVKAIISTQELNNLPDHLDFVMSTIPVSLDIPVILIQPFANDKDLEKIKKQIILLQTKKEILHVTANIANLFHPSLFFIHMNFNSKEEAITYMSKKVIQLGFADQNFTHNILQREKMSSTNFGNVAIPHSLHHTQKSFISVAILKDGLDWGHKKIKLILMIGIQKDKRKTFSQILNCLVEILYLPKNVILLCQQISYSDFVDAIIQMIQSIEEL